MKRPQILIVDDQQEHLNMLVGALEKSGYDTLTAHDGHEAILSIESTRPDLVITDLKMPRMDGIELLQEINRRFSGLPCMIVTGRGRLPAAVEAMMNGVHDFMLKPYRIEEIVLKVDAMCQINRARQSQGPRSGKLPRGFKFHGVPGTHPKMLAVYERISRVARTDFTVLVRGETGTGKEFVARAVHDNSARADGPYKVVNTVAIPENLIESKLFGYVRGAFSGAYTDTKGLLDVAQGGTVFLDEIGDIPQSIQAKLLRVLEYKTFERVGGNQTIEADVRIVAATNRDLEQAVEDGTFRLDLYERLKTFEVYLPPLRERPEDIPALAKHMLLQAKKSVGINIRRFDQATLDRLQLHSWKGNIRELHRVILNAIVNCDGGDIQCKHVEPLLIKSDSDSRFSYDLGKSFKEQTHDFHRGLIQYALLQANGVRTQAAKRLGMHRTTLLTRMRNLGLR